MKYFILLTNRLLSQPSSTNRLKNSFVPLAIRLYNREDNRYPHLYFWYFHLYLWFTYICTPLALFSLLSLHCLLWLL